MQLGSPFGTTLVDPSQATLDDQSDTVQSAGQLGFSATNYVANETDGVATITVVRTNGSSGTVTAGYSTVPGTAIPGVDYVSTSGTSYLQQW